MCFYFRDKCQQGSGPEMACRPVHILIIEQQQYDKCHLLTVKGKMIIVSLTGISFNMCVFCFFC